MTTKKLSKRVQADDRPTPPTDRHYSDREPERTATYWRNCYEAEYRRNEALRARWQDSQDEKEALKAQLKSKSGRKRIKRLT